MATVKTKMKNVEKELKDFKRDMEDFTNKISHKIDVLGMTFEKS
jgi:hypothetical protein